MQRIIVLQQLLNPQTTSFDVIPMEWNRINDRLATERYSLALAISQRHRPLKMIDESCCARRF